MIQILPSQRDVIGRSRIKDHEWTQAKPARQTDGAAEKYSISCIERCAPVIGPEIVRIGRKTRCARSVAPGIVQAVIAEERQLRPSANVEVRDQLILAENSIRRVLIDRALVWKRLRAG